MLCGFFPARQDDGSIACAENLMRRLFFLLALMCWTVAGVGQSNYGVISGAVSDAQHLRVAGAVVELKAAGTGAVRHVVTNDQGLFEAPALLPDDYEIKAAAQGFAVATQSVRLEVGQKLEVEFALKVGPVSEDVKVSGGNEVLHTSDATIGEVIEPKSIHELPLNGRMLIDLVLTVPGSHVGFGAQTGSTNPLYWRPGQRSAVVIGAIGRTPTTFCSMEPPTPIPPSTLRT